MECSSCGALYNKSCGCSKGGLVDKFVRDPNKTPDSSQRPPILCAKCGNPVEGPSCQGCALWRKKLKEVWFTTCHENGINQDLLNTSESSDDDTNVVNAPREPFVVKQDPGENSSQSPPQINHNCCYECGDSLDGIFCQQCTCKSCGKGAHPQFLVIYQSPQEMSMEALQAREDQMKSIENFRKKFNRISFRKTPKVLMQAWDKFLEIKHAQSEDVQDAKNKLHQDCKAENEEVSITPESPVTNSLIMEDEHLDTIPETKSDELIKSSIFPKRTVPNENFKIFSNPLFDLNEEITSTNVDQIDDEVLENTNSIPPRIEYPCFNAESDLLESLLHRDTSINDSQNIDSVLDEFAGKLTLLHSIPPGIDDVNLDPKGDILFFGEFALNITLLLALPERI
ncbi:hypothetical protein Tco_0201705 [Tanacetum coccineum]